MSTQQSPLTAASDSGRKQSVENPPSPGTVQSCHTVTAHTDGSYRCDGGASGIGFVLDEWNGDRLLECGSPSEAGTSMQAEAVAVLEATRVAKSYDPTRIVFYVDSPELKEKLENQLEGSEGVFADIASEWEAVDRIDVFKVPRNLNKKADTLANNAMLRDYDQSS